MSLFRDISYIKSISSSNNLKEVSDDACRLILWNMEIHLRTVIKEAIKYTQHFKRDNLTDEDVNCALLNVKQGDKMVGLRTPYENKYLLNEENRWSLENRVLVINERMKEVEFDHFENKHPIYMSLDWVAVGGKLVDCPSNKETVNLLEVASVAKPSVAIEAEGKGKGEFLQSKEVEERPNILSKEADKFLNSFFRILKETTEQIDLKGNKANLSTLIEGRNDSYSLGSHGDKPESADPRSVHREQDRVQVRQN
jgi:histone H3/H4